MAEIQDQAAIQFVNEYVRPLCELVRAAKARIDDAQLRWFDGLNTLIPNDAQATISRERLPTLTGADIHNIMGNLFAARDQVILDVVEAACVRPLEVTI